MPTEKGRSARIKAQKEARKQAETARNNAVTDALDRLRLKIAAEQTAVCAESYLRRERNTRKGESHLPPTHKLTARQIRDRIGEYYLTYADDLHIGVLIQRDETVCRVKKADLNLPETPELKRVKPKNTAQEYDPTLPTPREGRKRPSLQNNVRKAAKAPEPGVGKRAWKNLTQAERDFARTK